MSRVYLGESEDEYYGITCPDDLIEKESQSSDKEYDPYSDPNWGKKDED